MSELAWAASADAAALVVVDEIDDEIDDGAEPSNREIGGDAGHHLQRVRRLGIGEQIVVADGAGRWYLARVSMLGDGSLEVERLGPTWTEPRLHPLLTVAFAPAKSDRGTEVVHQLVELGVDRIVPLITQRAVVRWDGTNGAKAAHRLTRVAREAAEQCHRARVPDVDPPTNLDALLGRTDVLLAERDGHAVEEIALPAGGVWLVAVGPEGGFTPEEREKLAAATRIGIGPHTLRSVTAPVAVAAALAARRSPRL